MEPIAGLVEPNIPPIPSDSTIFILGAISGKLDMILARLDQQDLKHTKLEDRIEKVEEQLEKRIELTDDRLRDIDLNQKNQKFITVAVVAIAMFAPEIVMKFGGIIWSALA